MIFAALLPEAAAIAGALKLPASFKNKVVQGGDVAVVLVGPEARFLAELAPRIEAQAFVMAGLAGGLDPRLKIADVVADGLLPAGFCPPPPITLYRGRLHTSARLISSPAEKARLFAESSALAVDMETEHIRIFAQKRGVPFLALRAISDTASDALDPATLKLIDTLGRPKAFRAAGYLCAHPSRLPGLLRLAKNTRRALSHLALASDALLASNWPAG